MSVNIRTSKIVHDLLVALAAGLVALAGSDNMGKAALIAAATVAAKALARALVVGTEAAADESA